MEIVQNFSSAALTTGILLGCLGVIFLPSIVYAAFLLGAVFFCLAGIYVLLHADFVAAAQVLVYVGAINVLILFAIMLVNPQDAPPRALDSPPLIPGIACIGLLGVLVQMISTTSWLTPPWTPEPNSLPVLGGHLFSDCLLAFEVMSLVLLVALVGAIVLARREPVERSS
uniref:NAD(P)H-quinone oxidoreductase subunit 6, chloroplastic n=1 Tax=Nephroselmis olivacea TaxID=31312 RepID=NU6C_NEPOL|nr:NADH dehydrogenase subunit 6 [Nephroselmis olivacea]Q9TKV3.1 RecName: Full=NAD(P)H-quinone oxidoreductase subunit 6, chloroplastic; AltName: Full=NAD(P)H dehydrogenase subunit 6; AltName: Full=NADH-plastoquinone oxidoreductase subunit 6 [Nephroselmis olivacea]AAD54894.1 subunit 6 of NADH-plastoquinoneoxidoreductase [Nephroselmis olivacea]